MQNKLVMTFLVSIAFLASGVGVHAKIADQAILRLNPQRVKDLVLERNFDLKQAEMTKDMVYEGIPEAKGTFDTYLEADAAHQIDKFKRTSPLFGTRTDTTTWNLSLSKEIPSGTVVGLSFANTRSQTFGSNVGGVPVIPPNALYEPIIGFSITQPVLQNYFGVNDRGAVTQAKFAYDSADQGLNRKTDLIVYEALMDYWSVVFIKKHIKAQERSVKFAREFYNTMQEEKRLGTAEETDLLDAHANLLNRRDELLALKEMERTALEKLRRDLEFEPDRDVVVSLSVPKFAHAGEMSESRLELTFENRGDYQALLRDLDRLDVSLAVAKNTRWPKLDIFSTLELNEINTGYARAVEDMDSPNWTVGMAFSVPLENRAARAGARRAKADKARAIFALKNLENQIVNELSRLIEEVDARRSIVSTSRNALMVQRRKLSEEMKKFNQGRSTSFIIIRYQNDSIIAERHLVEAWLAYQKSALGLVLAEGTIVSDRQKQIKERDLK